MQFAKSLREGVRRGRIRCSVRIWTSPHVKAGGRYAMEEGQIVVDSIEPIDIEDITPDLAQESGFSSVEDLLQTAKHGRGNHVYLIRFHYLAPGGWDVQASGTGDDEPRGRPRQSPTLLQRIRSSAAPATRRREENSPAGGRRSRT